MNPHESSPAVFLTRWSLIEQARAEEPGSAAATRAVEQIIRHYRPAIVGAIRRHGIDSADSEDLCQEFLVRTFLSRTLPRADRARGRFRTFLLHSLRHFIASWHRAAGAQKRGGGRVGSLEELSPGELDTALAFEAPRAEFEFELDFASCLHAEVLGRLGSEYADGARQRVFEVLAPLILGVGQPSSEVVAAQLGMSPLAARQSLSRLRHRYLDAFRHEVAKLVDAGDDVEAETKDLLKLVWAAQSRGWRGGHAD